MKIHTVILLVVATYLLTLLVRFPADLVLANIDTAPLILDEPGGTVWSGEVQSVSLGSNRMEDVEWTVDFMPLLTGRVGARVEFKVFGGSGQASVARAFNGDVFVRDGELSIDAQALEALLPASLVQLGGQMQVVIERAHFTPLQPQSILGDLTWSKAVLKSPAQANLGDVTLTVIPNSEGHTAQLDNEGGALSMSGKLDVDRSGGYRADIRLKPQSGIPAELESALRLLGRKGSDGNYRLRKNGRLRDFL